MLNSQYVLINQQIFTDFLQCTLGSTGDRKYVSSLVTLLEVPILTHSKPQLSLRKHGITKLQLERLSTTQVQTIGSRSLSSHSLE